MTSHEPSASVPDGAASAARGRRSPKIRDRHLDLLAVVYIRQSSPQQVLDHKESRERQYELVDQALALGWAEVVGAADIFVGVNAVDYSGYPDCRPQFIEAFERLARLATKAGVEGMSFKIQAPLIAMSKADIIRAGAELGVDYGMTVSCYQAAEDGAACGKCDSCRLRAAGFAAARIPDPTRYR